MRTSTNLQADYEDRGESPDLVELPDTTAMRLQEAREALRLLQGSFQKAA